MQEWFQKVQAMEVGWGTQSPPCGPNDCVTLERRAPPPEACEDAHFFSHGVSKGTMFNAQCTTRGSAGPQLAAPEQEACARRGLSGTRVAIAIHKEAMVTKTRESSSPWQSAGGESGGEGYGAISRRVGRMMGGSAQ